MGSGIIVCKAGTHIRNDFVDPRRIVASKQGIHVEHHVSVEIHVIEALLIVATVLHGTNRVIRSRRRNITTCLQTAILQTGTHTRSKPLAYSYIQCRADTLAETAGSIIITKQYSSTITKRDKPIIPKGIGNNRVLVLTHFYDFQHFFCNFCRVLCYSGNRQSGQSQQH